MSRKQQYTAEQMIEALHEAHGLASVAARRLGCSDRTVRVYIGRYATVKAAQEEARERLLDLAESRLYEKIDNGDMRAIMFVLKTLGKDRGFVERQEIAKPADEVSEPIPIKLIDYRASLAEMDG